MLEVPRPFAVGVLEPNIGDPARRGGARTVCARGRRPGGTGEVDLEVAFRDLLRIAVEVDDAVLDQDRAVAERLQALHGVRDEEDRPALIAEPLEGVDALLAEPGVAHRQHLVDQHQVGVRLDHHRERQPHVHPAGVVLELHLDELLQLGELDHLVEPAPGLPRSQAHHHPVQQHVLAGGEVRVEAHPQLDERGQGAGEPDPAAVGSVDARQQLQERRLARPVAPRDPQQLPLGHPERDPAEGVEGRVLDRRERTHHALLQHHDPVARNPEGLVEVLDLDGDRSFGHCLAPLSRPRETS